MLYNQNLGDVYALAIDLKSNSLLAGGNASGLGQVVQYNLDSGKALRNFDSLEIGDVSSSITIQNLTFFGSMNSGCFCVIDSMRRRRVHGPVETRLRQINNLVLVKAKTPSSKRKALLVTSGYHSMHNSDYNDVFDVTRLVRQFGRDPGPRERERKRALINQNSLKKKCSIF